MSTISHHEAMRLLRLEHDKNKPFAPENGTPLKFKVGDKVTYTNEGGVVFEGYTVTRLLHPSADLYPQGYRYFIDSDAYWMPKKESELKHAD